MIIKLIVAWERKDRGVKKLRLAVNGPLGWSSGPATKGHNSTVTSHLGLSEMENHECSHLHVDKYNMMETTSDVSTK